MTLAARLRLTWLGVLAVATALAVALLPETAPRWLAGAIGVATLLALAPLALAIEVIVGCVVDPRRPRPSIAHLLRVWWHETLVTWRTFLWRQAFPRRDGPTLAPDPRRPAVLLIHGYLCNRAVWQPLLDAGVLHDCNVAAIDLEPVFADIDRYADVVAAGLDRLLGASGAARAVLVCHSMGGLAARAYLRRHGHARVARVITLATPHHGTVFGRFGLGVNARQMARGSRYLAALAEAEGDSLRTKFVCIATRDDNLVVPRASPLLPGATQHLLEGVGHLALIEDPRAWRLVAQEIRSIGGA
jgi:pimeloyl-ACP methyl ester carboxylesterase